MFPLSHSYRSFPLRIGEKRLLLETPTPEKVVESIVEKAEKGQKLNLTPDEFSIVAGNTEMLKRQTELKKLTHDRLLYLRTELSIDRKFLTVGSSADRTVEAQKVEQLEKDLGEIAQEQSQEAPLKEVSDIAAPKAEGEKGMKDTIKDFFKGIGITSIGALVKGYVSLRRTLMDFFPPKNAEAARKQLEGIERLYGRWFGVAEMQETVNASLKEQSLSLTLVEGTNDADMYGGLRIRWQKELDLKLQGALSPEGKDAIKAEDTFERFVQRAVNEYLENAAVKGRLAEKDAEGKTQKFVTTLKGIVNLEKPAPESAVPAAKTDQGKQGSGGFFASIFSSFTSFIPKSKSKS